MKSSYVRSRGAALLLSAVIGVTLAGVVGFAAAQDLDMDRVFRCHGEEAEQVELCAEARQMIVNDCTACHTFVPIVMVQFDRAGWNSLLDRHRDRVGHLSDEQMQTLLDYLAANFNPDQPPPELPPALLENWTSY